MRQLQNIPGIILFMRNTKLYNHLSYISFKISHLCNYTLLPTTVKVLESFLEAILWMPFQLFRHILHVVSSITKSPSLQYWFQSKEQVKISWSQVRRVWVRSGVVPLFFAKIPWPKPTGVLEHCRDKETKCWFSTLWSVSFWSHL